MAPCIEFTLSNNLNNTAEEISCNPTRNLVLRKKVRYLKKMHYNIG